MSSSRPKRICKEIALRAIRCEEDNPDVFDDSEADVGMTQVDDATTDNSFTDVALIEDDSLDESQVTNLSSDSSSSDDDNVGSNAAYTSSSGHVWTLNNPRQAQGRAVARNIIRFQDGVKQGINPLNERDALLMFLDLILEDCFRFSNLHGQRVVADWNRNNDIKHKWIPIDRLELEAFIGVLIFLGTFKSNYRDVDELWTVRDGFPVCRATFSRVCTSI